MAKSKRAISAREAADRYVDTVSRQVAARWPDLSQRVATAYPAPLDHTVGLIEATLAAAGLGMREIHGAVPPEIESRLRQAVASSLRSRFEHEAAWEIGESYEELWRNTGDPRAIGMGFVMRAVGHDPGDGGGGQPLVHFTVEKILGGAIVEAALGAWSEILAERHVE